MMEPNVDLDSLKAQFIGKIYVNEANGKPAPANLDGKEVFCFLFTIKILIHNYNKCFILDFYR